MGKMTQLFDRNLIFFENVSTQQGLFNSVGNKLLQRGLVKPKYVEAIIEREKNFPTGLDLSILGDDVPNVAIPHTEVEYCNIEQIIVVKLNEKIPFHNMIAPDKELDVKFSFFILNNKKTEQTGILSNLMGFFTKDNNMKILNSLNSNEEIYQFLINNTTNEE